MEEEEEESMGGRGVWVWLMVDGMVFVKVGVVGVCEVIGDTQPW
jgi:hypothetical protein